MEAVSKYFSYDVNTSFILVTDDPSTISSGADIAGFVTNPGPDQFLDVVRINSSLSKDQMHQFAIAAAAAGMTSIDMPGISVETVRKGVVAARAGLVWLPRHTARANASDIRLKAREWALTKASDEATQAFADELVDAFVDVIPGNRRKAMEPLLSQMASIAARMSANRAHQAVELVTSDFKALGDAIETIPDEVDKEHRDLSDALAKSVQDVLLVEAAQYKLLAIRSGK